MTAQAARPSRRTAVPEIPLTIATRRDPEPLPASRYRFPHASRADEQGLVAMGGDLEPATIVEAYRNGMFPWPHQGIDTLWWSPDPRAVLPVDGLHVPRRLARTVRQGRFRATLDAAFPQVIRWCAVRDEGTWITPGMLRAYCRLHELGWAHSFEIWTPDGDLAGGLYGLGVGGLFGAESMFHRATDASKLAMVAMVQHARRIGLKLIDVQLLTPHLASLGAVEMPRQEYLRRAEQAVEAPVRFRAG